MQVQYYFHEQVKLNVLIYNSCSASTLQEQVHEFSYTSVDYEASLITDRLNLEQTASGKHFWGNPSGWNMDRHHSTTSTYAFQTRHKFLANTATRSRSMGISTRYGHTPQARKKREQKRRAIMLLIETAISNAAECSSWISTYMGGKAGEPRSGVVRELAVRKKGSVINLTADNKLS